MNLVTLLDAAAAVMPAQVVLDDDGTVWTYQRLRHQAGQVARALRGRGLRPGDVVGTVQVPSSQHLSLLFGAWAAGASVVPLNFRLTGAELAQQVEASGATCLVVDRRYAELADGVARRLGGRASTVCGDELVGTADGCAEPVGTVADRDVSDTAVTLFTSGTTGVAKPVALSHGALFTDVTGRAEPPAGVSRGATLLAVPTYHVAGLSVLLASVYTGRRVVVMPAFDPERWLDLVRDRQVDHAFVVPTMLRRILASERFDTADLSGLRTLSYGAAAAAPALVREAVRRFPDTCGFVNAYGQTETGGTVTMLTPEDHRRAVAEDAGPDVAARLGSVGTPVPGVSIGILDSDGREVTDPGRTGEVAVRRAPRSGWQRTGDMGRLDAGGYLFLTGRSSEVIIRGGENIDPVEIEQVLESHPDIEEVAVLGQPDAEWGEIVVAFVVPRAHRTVDPAELRAHARSRLAGYKVPERVVVRSELPRNSLGKILKRVLREEHR